MHFLFPLQLGIVKIRGLGGVRPLSFVGPPLEGSATGHLCSLEKEGKRGERKTESERDKRKGIQLAFLDGQPENRCSKGIHIISFSSSPRQCRHTQRTQMAQKFALWVNHGSGAQPASPDRGDQLAYMCSEHCFRFPHWNNFIYKFREPLMRCAAATIGLVSEHEKPTQAEREREVAR